MEPLTRERLARSAFRTLGISGSATWSEIVAAARRIRIYSDPDLIPPTSWDLPILSKPARSRIDIQRAESLLEQPASRIEERLIWYLGSDPPCFEDHDLRTSDTYPGADGDISARHDAAIASLHLESSRDTHFADAGLWRNLLASMFDLGQSRELAESLESLENETGFEKRALPTEILEAVAALPIALAQAVLLKAENALEAGQLKVCERAVLLVRASNSEQSSKLLNGLFDGWEDRLQSLCRELDRDLREKLLNNQRDPVRFSFANHDASSVASHFYYSKINPVLRSILDLAEEDDDRRLRVRSASSKVLTLLALGWELSERFVLAEETLQNALSLAEGSGAATEILTKLKAIHVFAQKERLADGPPLSRVAKWAKAELSPPNSALALPGGKRWSLRDCSRLAQRAALLAIAAGLIWFTIFRQSAATRAPLIAAEKMSGDQLFRRGEDFYLGYGSDKPDPVEAMIWYRKAAKTGNALAMTRIGQLYLLGEGVDRDASTAFDWFERAADGGDPAGMWRLGEQYLAGNGVPRDPDAALTWLRRAAGAGQAPAMRDIAGVYAAGDGVPRDDGEARIWRKKAADAGDEESLRWLAQH